MHDVGHHYRLYFVPTSMSHRSKQIERGRLYLNIVNRVYSHSRSVYTHIAFSFGHIMKVVLVNETLRSLFKF